MIHKLFKGKSKSSSNDGAVRWAPWANVDITEDKIRSLIQIRIRFIDQAEQRPVDPEEPDLSGLLLTLASTTEQKESLLRMWKDEVEVFYAEIVQSVAEEGHAAPV